MKVKACVQAISPEGFETGELFTKEIVVQSKVAVFDRLPFIDPLFNGNWQLEINEIISVEVEDE